MAKRKDDHDSLKPSPHSANGRHWHLIEPALRAVPPAPQNPETLQGWDRFWFAVKDIRYLKDPEGEPVLSWTVYGVALLGGPYESQKFARRSKCPKCGIDAANLDGRGLLRSVCINCRLDHKRALDRLAAKRRRRKSGEVTTPSVMTCLHCGESFRPQRSTAKYCSPKCRVAHHRAN